MYPVDVHACSGTNIEVATASLLNRTDSDLIEFFFFFPLISGCEEWMRENDWLQFQSITETWKVAKDGGFSCLEFYAEQHWVLVAADKEPDWVYVRSSISLYHLHNGENFN